MQLRVDPKFIAKPPEATLLEKCRFILIRHGVTDFNMEFAKVVSAYGD